MVPQSLTFPGRQVQNHPPGNPRKCWVSKGLSRPGRSRYLQQFVVCEEPGSI
jgi:hypothetical protein